jgi:hypothetical protein
MCATAFFQARKGLDALHFLTDTGELPGVPREAPRTHEPKAMRRSETAGQCHWKTTKTSSTCPGAPPIVRFGQP